MTVQELIDALEALPRDLRVARAYCAWVGPLEGDADGREDFSSIVRVEPDDDRNVLVRFS